MKTICFDLRALQIGHEKRGIGMYIKCLLENLPATSQKYIFYVFDKNNPIKDLNIQLLFEYELVETPALKTKLESTSDISEQFKLLFHTFKELHPHRPDVFVQFDFALGIPRWSETKTVVIGYDLIPLIMKQTYLPDLKYAWNTSSGKKSKVKAMLRSIYYRNKFRVHYNNYKKADRVIAISNSSAESFRDLLNIKDDKLFAIPLAPVVPANNSPDLIVANRIREPYIFYIGGTDNRKRIQDIVYAFNIVKGRGFDLKLVLAGNEFRKLDQIPSVAGREAIRSSTYKEDIVLAGFVTDKQKMGLYKKAHAFIFCSEYEGFGLPIVEAMTESCPVIAYNNSSIPETAGTAGLLVNTGDYVAVANQILALRDAKFREKTIQAGVKQASKFSWSKYIKEFSIAIDA